MPFGRAGRGVIALTDQADTFEIACRLVHGGETRGLRENGGRFDVLKEGGQLLDRRIWVEGHEDRTEPGTAEEDFEEFEPVRGYDDDTITVPDPRRVQSARCARGICREIGVGDRRDAIRESN